MITLLPFVGAVDLVVVPELEGAKKRWQWLDRRRVAVAPSLFEEIKKQVPTVQR